MRPAALVTGGSSGIGAATCRLLRTEGWYVIGAARRPCDEADEFIPIDVADYSAVHAAFANLQPLTLLVHAAAVIGPLALLQESDAAAWRRAAEVNLLGTYNVLRATLPGPLANPGSIIIHLTSGAASRRKPYWSAYSASKAGAEHLVRSAAADLDGTGRAVCNLDPGVTETPMQEQIRTLDFPDRDRFLRIYDEHSGSTPMEVAAAVLELSRRDPEELNGQSFRVGSL